MSANNATQWLKTFTITGPMAVQMQIALEDSRPGEPLREKWQRVIDAALSASPAGMWAPVHISAAAEIIEAETVERLHTGGYR